MRYARFILATFATALCAAPAAAQNKGPCFFLQPNYQGDPMCISPTQRLPTLGAAIKNKIMSAQIPPGMRVTICDSDNFGGSCQTVSQSIADFATIGAAGKVASLASEAAAQVGGRPNNEPPPPAPMRPGPATQAKGPPPPSQAAPPPTQAAPPPQTAAPTPPAPQSDGTKVATRTDRDDEYVRELRRLLSGLLKECEDGEKVACVRLGFMIGENRVRRSALRQVAPELFWWDK
jgi:peptidase inhibitor family I36